MDKSLDKSLLNHSSIILSNDFQKEIEFLKDNINYKNLRIFHTNELRAGNPSITQANSSSSQKINLTKKNISDEDSANYNKEKYIYARDIIEEAYASNIDKKYIAILANTFNVDAQNALLKALEEPPKNIIFILFANAKNKLLPTIRSRLILIDRRLRVEIDRFKLNINELNTTIIYDYIQEISNQNINFNEAKNIVHSILNKSLESNISLDEVQLQRFQNSINALNKKADAVMVLMPLLLSLLEECK